MFLPVIRLLQQLQPTCTDIIIHYTLLRGKGGQVGEDVKDLNVHLVFTLVLLQTYRQLLTSCGLQTHFCNDGNASTGSTVLSSFWDSYADPWLLGTQLLQE
jgi:hypothetical protein